MEVGDQIHTPATSASKYASGRHGSVRLVLGGG